ncbi:SDR family NAD(P)-dependent oxidoreductase [Glaciecola siphonariae]|uniref:SDR family NAD(P)-dependent oxidoreductase n=1 Tax=Glaciecola siphonariae TaxID=521012 RepID=A0ABV9LX69_9ALTE
MTNKIDNHENNQPDLSRRKIVGAVAAGAALAATAGISGAANAQENAQPLSREFSGKTVLITGGTSGIGAETAREFARHGANVAFCGRRESLGKQVESEITASGGTATFSKVDVRDPKALRTWIDKTANSSGSLDIAFNNAGIAIPPGPIENVDPAQYKDIIDTNLHGVFFAMQAQIPHMKSQGSGVIINTSSAFGSHAPNTQVPYGATKGAVDTMTEGVAKEIGGNGIRVLAVAPGAILDTDLFRFIGRSFSEDEISYFGTLAAMGRTGRPNDIAKMVVALAGTQGSFVHGTVVPIDGMFLQS